MKTYVYIALVALAFGASGATCANLPPTPTPIPTPADSGVSDVPTQSGCQQMCAKLETLGCPEATKHGLVKCNETCEHIISSSITNLDVNCVLSSSTDSQQAVQKCGISCK